MKEQRVHLNIPLTQYQPVLSWDQETIDHLVNTAIQLAVRVGIRIDNDPEGVYLKEAQSKGAQVDWEAHAVMFTEEDIRQTIEVARQTHPASAPAGQPQPGPAREEQQFFVGNGANLVFDWQNWRAKPPAAQDLVDLCHWAQGCEDVGSLFPPVMLKDLDQRLSPLYSYALMARHCRKPVYHEQPTEPLHVRYLQRMARVVEKHRGYFQEMQPMEYVNPPFRMGRRAIAAMLERVDSGACRVMGIGPMSVAGMSAPITVAGLAVTSLAEILGACTLLRILRPGYGLRLMVCNGALDLRTARVSYFGMHTHLCNLATWELVVRGLGVGSGVLTFYRDANEPGMQALYEYGMNQAFFSSVVHRAYSEIGGLCNGNIFSPHQAVMDMELIKEFNELTYGFEVSEAALGVEEVVAARFSQGTHMGTEHTLEFMKDGVPYSDFLYRGLPAGAQHDPHRTQTQELLEKAAAEVDKALAQGRQMEPDVELSEELYGYVKEAAAELGIDAPPLV